MLAALVNDVLAPWAARIQRELGRPVIVAANLGANVWIGDHTGASGRMDIVEPQPPLPDRGNLAPIRSLKVTTDRLALKEERAYTFKHLMAELRLVGIQIRAMYESDATAVVVPYEAIRKPQPGLSRRYARA